MLKTQPLSDVGSVLSLLHTLNAYFTYYANIMYERFLSCLLTALTLFLMGWTRYQFRDSKTLAEDFFYANVKVNAAMKGNQEVNGNSSKEQTKAILQ